MDRRAFLCQAAGWCLALRAGSALGAPVQRLALVTADTEARIVVVDVAAGRVVRSFEVLPGPRSVEAFAGGRLAVVAHTAYGAVSIVDAHGVRRVLRAFEEPRYTAAHPGGEYVLVTDSARSELVTVELARGRVVHRLRLTEWARHVTIDAAARTAWVGLGTASDRVAVVSVADPRRPRLLDYVTPPFGAHDVGWQPGSQAVWVTSGNRREVAVYDGPTRRLLRRLPSGAAPQHVTFGRDVAYVTSGADGTLRLHRLADGTLLRSTAVPVGSYNVQAGDGRVLTPSLDRGTLCVLDGRGALLHRVRVAPSSHDACLV